MDDQTISFSFGKNWQAFVASYLTPERVAIATHHLAEFLEMPDLHGQYFLDIGCGSGLSSFAAHELRATKIVSFDLDPDSVAATRKLKAMAGNPEHWEVLQGSILDEQFIAAIPKADIVYAWGVLHHTGKMWEALEKAAGLAADNGLLYIALYTKGPQSAYWHRVKQRYNHASKLEKCLMEAWFIFKQGAKNLLRKRINPIRYVLEYRQKRGMAYLTDVRDWLGGYPYEDASIEEVVRFARKQLQLELINITNGGEGGGGNSEYLFLKKM